MPKRCIHLLIFYWALMIKMGFSNEALILQKLLVRCFTGGCSNVLASTVCPMTQSIYSHSCKRCTHSQQRGHPVGWQQVVTLPAVQCFKLSSLFPEGVVRSKGAYRALCARCAKSRPFSTTGRQFFPFLRVCDLANGHPEAGIW